MMRWCSECRTMREVIEEGWQDSGDQFRENDIDPRTGHARTERWAIQMECGHEVTPDLPRVRRRDPEAEQRLVSEVVRLQAGRDGRAPFPDGPTNPHVNAPWEAP